MKAGGWRGRAPAWSKLVAHDGDPLNDPLTLEVVEHEVLGATIVPDGDGAFAPAFQN
jgi:hypothetical protein